MVLPQHTLIPCREGVTSIRVDPTIDFGFVKIGDFPIIDQSDTSWKLGFFLSGGELVLSLIALAEGRRFPRSL